MASFPRRPAWRPLFVLACFFGLHFVAAHAAGACLWGADALAYLPRRVEGLFAAGAVVLLVPGLRHRLVAVCERIPSVGVSGNGSRTGLTGTLLLVAAIAAIAAIFVLLRSASPLLGDGQLHLHDLRVLADQTGVLPQAAWGNNNSPLSYWLIHSLHRGAGQLWESPETTFRLVSWITGALYLLLCVPVARQLGANRTEHGVALALLCTAGFLQLFCGYIETYALILPVMLVYLSAGLRSLQSGGSLLPPALLLGMLVPMHLALATLVPSFLVLLIARPHAPSGAVTVSRPGRGPFLKVAALVGGPALALILFRLIGFDVLAYLREARATHFLPLFSEPSFLQAYRLFSPAHLLDAVNELVLVAPALVLVLALLGRGGVTRDATDVFLATATIFPWLFTFVANPEIGAFRDWDALAFPALPGTLWAARLLVKAAPQRIRLAELGTLVAGAAALHTLAWIGVNANPVRAETRFTVLLEECRLSAHARSYGWESLGTLRRAEGRLGDAVTAYQAALASNPGNPRLWKITGETLCVANRFAEAVPHFEKAIVMNPGLGRTYFFLGNAHVSLGENDAAVERYREALARGADDANVHHNLGLALYRLGKYEEAVTSFRRAVARKPDFTLAHFNLGAAYGRLGRAEEARACARKVLALDPHGPQAAVVRDWLD